MQERIQEQHGTFLIEDNNEEGGGRRRTRSSLRGNVTPTSAEKSPVPAKRARTVTATTPTSAKKAGRTPAKKNLSQLKDEVVSGGTIALVRMTQ